MEENAQPPNQLICSSFNNTTPLEPQVTVGICVVTRGDKNLVGSDDKYRKFLRARAEEFFNSAYRIIRDKQLIPFTE
ncbi:MAG TPA: hypothetical protein VE863_08530, partial [Pyrinomonadaceae bacterium]|nr:hypothetical protein [Pyrinomonadaceae bacterium]